LLPGVLTSPIVFANLVALSK
jgi:large subunit ribosomal protein L8e